MNWCAPRFMVVISVERVKTSVTRCIWPAVSGPSCSLGPCSRSGLSLGSHGISLWDHNFFLLSIVYSVTVTRLDDIKYKNKSIKCLNHIYLGQIMRYDKAHELQHISVTRKLIRLLVKHNNVGLIPKEKRSQVRLSSRPLLEPVLVSLSPMTPFSQFEPETWAWDSFSLIWNNYISCQDVSGRALLDFSLCISLIYFISWTQNTCVCSNIRHIRIKSESLFIVIII